MNMRVAVLGMGVIGQRLVHGVSAQPDMEISGIAVRSLSSAVHENPHYPYFASGTPGQSALVEGGIDSRGDLSSLLAESDVIVDCGQAGTGARRYDAYRAAGVKAIFCGGERDPELGPLVNSHLNYDVGREVNSLRLLSCNTTALARITASLGASDVSEVVATILRCSGDHDSTKRSGAVVQPGTSHHAADLRSVLGDVFVESTAVTVPMSAGHVVHARVKLLRGATHSDTRTRLAEGARTTVHPTAETLDTAAIAASTSTSSSGPPCRYEVLVRLEPLVEQHEVEAWLSLDHAAITIPETIDAIRAICGGHDADEARALTDAALGITCASHQSTSRAAVLG
jgi:glyceraldehyde-3-phosphate dehydrogenase (NAD(P))